MMPAPATSLIERFWPKVDASSPDGCWTWLAGKSKAGYGVIGAGPRKDGLLYAHRVSYELLVGPIPRGMQIDHLCRNRGCVRPDHLEVVTQQENIARGESRSTKNARATECVRGHAFDEANTSFTKSGGRRCKTCHREAERARNERKRAI